MGLNKTMLRTMGLNEDQVASIMAEVTDIHQNHINVVSRMQGEIDKYKADAEKLPGVQKELDAFKKDDWKTKFEDERKAFESYKTEQAEAVKREAKEKAFDDFIDGLKLTQKGKDIAKKYADLEKFELDEDGKFKNAKDLAKEIEAEWEDYIDHEVEQGAEVDNPPDNDLEGRSNFESMTLTEKMLYANEHPTAPEVINFLK